MTNAPSRKTPSEHFRQSADALVEEHDLGPDTLVMEAGSNDGYMLRHFAARGIPVLGIDPAKGPATAAVEAGIPTRNTFFGRDLAEEMRDWGMQADLFLANDVLAHVPDLNGFVEGIATILSPHGTAVIYHQHLCYFSVTALDTLFRRHGLYLDDVQHVSIHGGSLRLFVEHTPGPALSTKTYRLVERTRAISS